MKRSVWIIIAVVVVVGGLAIAMMTKQPSTKSASSSSPSPTQASAASKSGSQIITYSNSGFSPAQTTVKSGDSVTFENKTTEQIQVDSNPHPIHTDDPDLNVGTIAPGASATATLTKKGTFGFHNHFNPADTAQVTIQ